MKWWGYKHTNGSIQVKRCFSLRDIEEANSSPFVLETTEAFNAKDRDEAIKITRERLK